MRRAAWEKHRVKTALVVCLFMAACSDRTEDEVRAQVAILLAQEGSAAPIAAERLAQKGRAAIPIIESALHTATPVGKKNLILALRKISDPAARKEAIPLLGHLAGHDPLPDVRREAEWTLKQWAATGDPSLATEARKALRALDEAKGTEEAG